MRKDILVASVQKDLIKQTSLTQDSQKFVHRKVVEAEIAKVYDQILKTFYASGANLINYDLDYYAKKFTSQPIQKDDDGFLYVTLPVRPVELRGNNGIRYVRGHSGQFSFVRTRDVEIEAIKNLEVYCMAKKAFYYIDGNRIVIDTPIPEFEIIESVDIKLLPLFTEFDDSDNIEFPTGGKQPTDMVLETMGFRPTDNINDDVR